jgi:hypothetical protein
MAVTRECPFCRRTHTGDFEPDLDEEVMRCRDRAVPGLRGDLDAFEDRATVPIPIEREVIQRTKDLEREIWIGMSP